MKRLQGQGEIEGALSRQHGRLTFRIHLQLIELRSLWRFAYAC